ncbi:alpha/beta fold hydrolase [Saccharothrix sp. Mg75]|uniref:alpha/beta fold hydrolase n=1 Tax=Saccharothrix sp. Mg75 TaxID=3445357 RepID=UPI003EEDF627
MPVVLVHGYPDTSSVWDEVAERLGRRFRVVRYDVRGCGGSEAPGERDGYRVEVLVEDLLAVVREAGAPVHLVGHDWGSVQGWAAVAAHPGLFRSFVSLSGPGLAHLGRVPVRTKARSWYVGVFLVPGVAEAVWRVGWVRRLLRAGRRELVNGLELYRANVGRRFEPVAVEVPVHQVELVRDPFVGPGHLDAAKPWVRRLTRSRVRAGHWALRTHPDLVAERIGAAIGP